VGLNGSDWSSNGARSKISLINTRFYIVVMGICSRKGGDRKNIRKQPKKKLHFARNKGRLALQASQRTRGKYLFKWKNKAWYKIRK